MRVRRKRLESKMSTILVGRAWPMRKETPLPHPSHGPTADTMQN